ncbi:hypothetical protein H072_7724 [Dactylellina haptotyla CBS 200.50]|uniref:SHSP domain-containing protein n=1 Tax=Dactylellina haptotyla (strain CBS 200.50) TaxID=1284197 RepID=S8A6N3_DACHA|nr:hypothetical protein H072_7724 [Dactylellina haptotyla CBS 200.50]
MPFVRFHPASFASQADPFVDLLAAALAAEAAPAQKPASFAKKAACTPAQCQTRSCAPQQNRVVKRFITPRFDVSETEDSYILEAELPGVSNKSTISVDFDDAQTIVVKGEISRVKRAFSKNEGDELTEEALQAAAAAQEKASVTTTEGETVVYDDAASVSSNKSKGKAATVEDDVDESETASNASFEVVDGPTKADKGKALAKDADVEMTEAAEKPAQPTTTKAKKTAKYWIAERPVGVFERKFKFEGLIDQDNVRASLENGLLTVIIPKREAFVRSIFIN